MKKIARITLRHELDDNPSLDYLGEWSDEYQEGAIPHSDDPNHYKYFISCNHGTYKEENWDHVSDDDKQKVIDEYGSLQKAEKAYARQDYERRCDFMKGKVYYIGISAEAEIHTSEDGKNWLINEISGGGLWGIESDSDESYPNEVEQEQLDALRIVLKELGFTEQEFIDAPVFRQVLNDKDERVL